MGPPTPSPKIPNSRFSHSIWVDLGPIFLAVLGDLGVFFGNSQSLRSG